MKLLTAQDIARRPSISHRCAYNLLLPWLRITSGFLRVQNRDFDAWLASEVEAAGTTVTN